MVVNSNWIRRPITDVKFKTLINNIGNFNIHYGPWIAGGCVRKLWQDIKWRHEDIDIFFRDKNQFDKFVNKTKQKKSIIDIFSYIHISENIKKEKIRYDLQYDTTNAKTFSVTLDGINGNNVFKVQTICKFFPESAITLINDFDWTICQFISDGKHMWATPEALEGLTNNKIILSSTTQKGIKAPRVIKYMTYGFDVDDKLYINMLQTLNNTTTRDEVLEDDY